LWKPALMLPIVYPERCHVCLMHTYPIGTGLVVFRCNRRPLVVSIVSMPMQRHRVQCVLRALLRAGGSWLVSSPLGVTCTPCAPASAPPVCDSAVVHVHHPSPPPPTSCCAVLVAPVSSRPRYLCIDVCLRACVPVCLCGWCLACMQFGLCAPCPSSKSLSFLALFGVAIILVAFAVLAFKARHGLPVDVIKLGVSM
jgi:hypothetical protein